MATRKAVYKAIDSERDYQIAMAEKAHGDPSSDYSKSLENFALYINDYARELTGRLTRTWGPGAYIASLATVRKIAALAVAAMEVHGAPKRTAPMKRTRGTGLT